MASIWFTKNAPHRIIRGGGGLGGSKVGWVGPKLGGWVLSKIPPPSYKRSLLLTPTPVHALPLSLPLSTLPPFPLPLPSPLPMRLAHAGNAVPQIYGPTWVHPVDGRVMDQESITTVTYSALLCIQTGTIYIESHTVTWLNQVRVGAEDVWSTVGGGGLGAEGA